MLPEKYSDQKEFIECPETQPRFPKSERSACMLMTTPTIIAMTFVKFKTAKPNSTQIALLYIA